MRLWFKFYVHFPTSALLIKDQASVHFRFQNKELQLFKCYLPLKNGKNVSVSFTCITRNYHQRQQLSVDNQLQGLNSDSNGSMQVFAPPENISHNECYHMHVEFHHDFKAIFFFFFFNIIHDFLAKSLDKIPSTK